MKKFLKQFYGAILGIFLLGVVFSAPALKQWNNSKAELSQYRMLFTDTGLPNGTPVMDINSGGSNISHGPLLDGELNPYITGYSETDPVWMASSGDYYTLNPLGYISGGQVYANLTQDYIPIYSGDTFYDSVIYRSGTAMSIGTTNTINSDYSFAVGQNNVTNGNYGIAMGQFNKANGLNSFSIGVDSEANGYASVAAGESARANRVHSIAMGNSALADGVFSIAIGILSQADGISSVAIGHGANAINNYSTAIGQGTRANSNNTTVIGKYNLGLTDSLFEIGNGSGSTIVRDNVLTVFNDGKVAIGTTGPNNLLEVNGEASYTSTGNMGADPEDFASKFYVDSQLGGYYPLAGNDSSNPITGDFYMETGYANFEIMFDEVDYLSTGSYGPYIGGVSYISGVGAHEGLNIKGDLFMQGTPPTDTNLIMYGSDLVHYTQLQQKKNSAEFQIRVGSGNVLTDSSTKFAFLFDGRLQAGTGIEDVISDNKDFITKGYLGTKFSNLTNKYVPFRSGDRFYNSNIRRDGINLSMGNRDFSTGVIDGISIGTGTQITKSYGVAIGNNSKVYGLGGVAIQNGYAAGTGSFSVIGGESYGYSSISFGYNSRSYAPNSFSLIGGIVTGTADYGVAIGNGVITNSQFGFNIGRYNEGLTNSIFEIGYGTGTSYKKNALTINDEGKIGVGTTSLDIALMTIKPTTNTLGGLSIKVPYSGGIELQHAIYAEADIPFYSYTKDIYNDINTYNIFNKSDSTGGMSIIHTIGNKTSYSISKGGHFNAASEASSSAFPGGYYITKGNDAEALVQGSRRMVISGDNLSIQVYTGGAWVEKRTLAP